jgi:thioredoxin reductase
MAVVGAGPVGLEMALAGRALGFDVRVYEAGRVGETLRRFDGISLFTPFSMNSTEETRARLERAGARLPGADSLLTAGELVRSYLEPIAALPDLRGRIIEGARVAAIARDDVSKSKQAGAPGGPPRSHYPFVLRIEGGIEKADVVVDASGVVSRPLATGPGGIGAAGEEALGARADRHLPETRAAARERFAGLRVLLVGCGHSAATAVSDFDTLARDGGGPARVEWVHRDHRDRGATPIFEHPDDPLPARATLAREANAIAARAPWLARHPGSAILAYEPIAEGATRVRLREPGGKESAVVVDRVLALVGYRPDTDLFRELRVHLCYASEAPMALAAALLAARNGDRSSAGASAGATAGAIPGDCLAQTTHGPETLRTTEPGFFVIGAKAYGRSPDFLLRVGYEQVREVASLLRGG